MVSRFSTAPCFTFGTPFTITEVQKESVKLHNKADVAAAKHQPITNPALTFGHQSWWDLIYIMRLNELNNSDLGGFTK